MMNEHSFPQIREAPHVIGRLEDADLFTGEQEGEDTCTIRCEEFVLELFTGLDFDEKDLLEEARANGWHKRGGRDIEDVGNLLDSHGVPTNRYIHADIHNLAAELAQGHKVIIGVNAGELWSANPLLENLHQSAGADHTVVVSGIDTTHPDNVAVIVSDPGTGEPAARYPLNAFLSAWEDSDFFMVATRDPVPAWAPEMANFDYEAGHLPSVAGLPYEDFAALEGQPEVLSALLQTFEPAALDPHGTDGHPGGSGDAAVEDDHTAHALHPSLDPWDAADGQPPESGMFAPDARDDDEPLSDAHPP